MAMIFTQTDTDGSCTPAGFIIAPKQATVGGTAGTGTPSVLVSGSGTSTFGFDCIIPASTTWSAGDWTIRFRVTTANMNLTWTYVAVLQRNSTCGAISTLFEDATLSTSLSTTGVKSYSVVGASGVGSPGGTDKLIIACIVTNGAMTNQSFNFTPDQNIDSPFTAAAVFIAKPSFIVRQAVNRASTY